jgi:hypothetical protein
MQCERRVGTDMQSTVIPARHARTNANAADTSSVCSQPKRARHVQVSNVILAPEACNPMSPIERLASAGW